MIRTAIVAVFLTIFVLLAGPFLLLHAVMTGSADVLYDKGLGAVLFIVRVMGMRTRVEGLENIPAGTCVFAANHTSYADPPAIVGAIPRRIAILAKKSLFGLPLAGTAFRLAHFIPVDRQDREGALASLDLAAKAMKGGTSFLIYPEGTRSPDGRLLPFKHGAFALAIQAGVPVIPVACAGAHRILPKGSLGMRPGEVTVRFCPPVDATGYTFEGRRELSDRVRSAIAAALPADQRPLA
jgi:1-acyl-sn-glycerol-3-phosphate acyltransferase